jgi:hypothetical protein
VYRGPGSGLGLKVSPSTLVFIQQPRPLQNPPSVGNLIPASAAAAKPAPAIPSALAGSPPALGQPRGCEGGAQAGLDIPVPTPRAESPEHKDRPRPAAPSPSQPQPHVQRLVQLRRPRPRSPLAILSLPPPMRPDSAAAPRDPRSWPPLPARPLPVEVAKRGEKKEAAVA